MDRISLVKVEAPQRNPNAILAEKGFSYLNTLICGVTKRVQASAASFLKTWNEQAVRAAEIERMRALDRARLDEKVSWLDNRSCL